MYMSAGTRLLDCFVTFLIDKPGFIQPEILGNSVLHSQDVCVSSTFLEVILKTRDPFSYEIA